MGRVRKEAVERCSSCGVWTMRRNGGGPGIIEVLGDGETDGAGGESGWVHL